MRQVYIYLQKIQAIHRTPGNEHLVTGDDIAQPIAGDTETKKPQPKSSNGKPRPCLFKCGRLAAEANLYCEECRSEFDQSRQSQ
jgi:hypothetical protein